MISSSKDATLEAEALTFTLEMIIEQQGFLEHVLTLGGIEIFVSILKSEHEAVFILFFFSPRVQFFISFFFKKIRLLCLRVICAIILSITGNLIGNSGVNHGLVQSATLKRRSLQFKPETEFSAITRILSTYPFTVSTYNCLHDLLLGEISHAMLKVNSVF